MIHTHTCIYICVCVLVYYKRQLENIWNNSISIFGVVAEVFFVPIMCYSSSYQLIDPYKNDQSPHRHVGRACYNYKS